MHIVSLPSVVVWKRVAARFMFARPATDTPIPGIPIYSCVPTYNPGFASGYFLATLGLETALFLLALWKSVESTTLTNGFSRWIQSVTVTDVMLRDTVVYFLLLSILVSSS